MHSILQDLRYAIRQLRRSRGFTIVAVLSLAVGIGVNTAIFSIVNSLLFRPLPLTDPDRVVSLYSANERQGVDDWGVSHADLVDWQTASGVFEEVGARAGRSFTLTGGDQTERIQGGAVTPNLFPLLGVQPALGRSFRPEEEAHAGFEQVVILSHGLWRNRFGADPGIIGRPIHINDRELTVVGVMPPRFEFPETDKLWVPWAPSPTEVRSQRYLWGFGRLKPGVTVEQARSALDGVAMRLADRFPDSNRGWGARVVSLRDDMVDPQSQQLLYLMLGAVGFVLLIACANVANLLLARATYRDRELAVRTALGASRMRIIRQLLTESVLVALAGGALGILIAVWWLDLTLASIPEELPYWMRFGVDGRVLLYTLAVSLMAGILFGGLPALRASRPHLQVTLKEAGRGAVGGRSRLRSALVVGEIALSVVLLAGATLMVKSFLRLQQADAGFETERILTLRTILSGDRYDPISAKAAFFQQTVERVAALPSVRGAAATTAIPTDDGGRPTGIIAEGQPRMPGEELAGISIASPAGLFDALGQPLLAGRGFTAQEAADSLGTSTVINQSLAAHLWPGEDPIGKRIHLGAIEETPWFTVIGVAPDLQYEEFGEQTPQSQLQVHLPYARSASRQMALLVRSAGDPAILAESVRNEVQTVDSGIATFDVRTMEQVRHYTTWQQGFFSKTFGIFAAVALLLAALGIYGVMAYTVAQRVREIGIRMALGARPADVLRLVVANGAMLAALGIAIGLVGAFQLTQLLRSVLYEVSASDPVTFLFTPAILVVVTLIASYLPARRATRVDPMVALRAE